MARKNTNTEIAATSEPKPDAADEYLKISDVARILNTHVSWVRRAVRDGRLPAPVVYPAGEGKRGQAFRFRRSEMETWLGNLPRSTELGQ